jgi:hypothetical protein
MNCIFCNSPDPKSVEHVIPETLGNDDLVLVDKVCRACNSAFGKVENYVLSKTPIAFWRTFLGIKTKKGKLPWVELSKPATDRGIWSDHHDEHDDGIAFESHVDGSTSINIDDDTIINEILNGEKHRFKFVLTPKSMHLLGRFMAKIGIELLCISDQYDVRSDRFNACRNYARYGSQNSLWPLFHFKEGSISSLKRFNYGAECEKSIDIDCYSYSLKSIGNHYIVFCFGVGTDRWVICLDQKFPHPIIREAFGGKELNLMWYSDEELAKKSLERTR